MTMLLGPSKAVLAGQEVEAGATTTETGADAGGDIASSAMADAGADRS